MVASAPSKAADVAVLVRSHRQGRLVGAALARLGVASVQQAEDSVFTSRERADELRSILTGVAEPGRDDVVRAALGTELLGVTGEALFALREATPDGGPSWTPSSAFIRCGASAASHAEHVPRAGGEARAYRRAPADARGRRAPEPAPPGRVGRGRAAPARSGRARAVDGRARGLPTRRARSSSSHSRATSTWFKIVTVGGQDEVLLSLDLGRTALRHDSAANATSSATIRKRTNRATLEWKPTCRRASASRPVTRSWRRTCGLLRRADARHPPLHHGVGGDQRCRHVGAVLAAARSGRGERLAWVPRRPETTTRHCEPISRTLVRGAAARSASRARPQGPGVRYGGAQGAARARSRRETPDAPGDVAVARVQLSRARRRAASERPDRETPRRRWAPAPTARSRVFHLSGRHARRKLACTPSWGASTGRPGR